MAEKNLKQKAASGMVWTALQKYSTRASFLPDCLHHTIMVASVCWLSLWFWQTLLLMEVLVLH